MKENKLVTGYQERSFELSRYQKWTVCFCLLTASAISAAQAFKETIYYAPLIGWASGLLFSILALVMAIKAYNQRFDT